MKKKLTRILAALLIAMMLIPTLATFAVSAEETGSTIDISDIVNLYELNQLDATPNKNKTKDAMYGEPTEEKGKLISKPFESTRDGDKYIYVGPCPDPAKANYNDILVYWYKKDGSYTSEKKIGELQDNVVDRFDDGSVILKIKNTSSNYKYAVVKVPNTYAELLLITSERPFTVAEYYAYADANGIKLEGTSLRPAPPEIADEAPEGNEGFWNYFSLSDSFTAPSTQKEATNVYTSSKYIPVTEGDVITMGAISTKETQNILYAYSNEVVPGKSTGGIVTSDYKEVKKYKRGDIGIDFVENIGYDYAIYSYTVPEGVSYVKVSAPASVAANGDILVTKNQAFKTAQLREALEIAELSNEAKKHDFNGKNALFVGDSIFYGENDTPASYSAPATSFARRLALATGLIPTDMSAVGATIAKTGKSNVKYAYDLMKTAHMSKKVYDMVIIQGGINDARNGVEIGTILPVDTDREVLAANERTATFAGALQLMFYDALNKWTEAEFYFVASYKTLPEAVNEQDMSLYYAQAKALCEIYGIHYIDLYNDTELYTAFDYTNAELFADDKFTPVAETYNALFPSVLRLFNNSLNEDLTNPFAAKEEENNSGSILPPVADDTDSEGLDTGVIIAIAAAGVVGLAGGGFALYCFVLRKKKVAPVASNEAEAPAPEAETTTEEKED